MSTRRTPANMAFVNGQYDRTHSAAPEPMTFEEWCDRYHFDTNDYARPIYDAYVNGWNNPKVGAS